MSTRSVRKPPIPSPQQEERSSTGPKRAPCASSQPKSAAELAAAVGASRMGGASLSAMTKNFSVAMAAAITSRGRVYFSFNPLERTAA